MHKLPITIICFLFVLLNACKKDEAPAATILADGSVGVATVANKDTMVIQMPILSDSAIIIKLQAILSGETANTDHWVKLTVDTLKIKDYRAKYGNDSLLPSSAYYFYKSQVRLQAGASLSDSAVLNLGQQTKLMGYTTYVLPVVVQSVDNNTDIAAKSKVLYLIIKTGKPAFYTKTGWTIAGYSSQNAATVAATKLIDDNETTTYWLSQTTQSMPQWVAINFNKTLTFSAVTYYYPTVITYPTSGGYPTSILIETSMDGTTWTNNGTYAGNIVSNAQTINTGTITARYLRFTSLAVVKYSGLNVVFVAGIKVIP